MRRTVFLAAMSLIFVLRVSAQQHNIDTQKSTLTQTLEKTNPNFHLICTMTEMSKSKKEWKGEVVPIDREMLSRNLTTLQGSIYYSAGPPAMVAGMKEMLVGQALTKRTSERKTLRDTEVCPCREGGRSQVVQRKWVSRGAEDANK